MKFVEGNYSALRARTVIKIYFIFKENNKDKDKDSKSAELDAYISEKEVNYSNLTQSISSKNPIDQVGKW